MQLAHDLQRAEQGGARRRTPEGEARHEQGRDPTQDRVAGLCQCDQIERIRADQPAGLLHLARQRLPRHDRSNGGEGILTLLPRGDQRFAEPGEEPDLVVDGPPVSLERSVLAGLGTAKQLAEQPVEHRHGLVGQCDLGLQRRRHKHRSAAGGTEHGQMLGGQAGAFLGQPAQPFRMDALRHPRVQVQAARVLQPLDHARERPVPQDASRLANPGHLAQPRSRPQLQQGVQPRPLGDIQPTGQLIGDVALRLQHGGGHQALHHARARNDDLSASEFVHQEAGDVGTARGGQRHGQEPCL